MEVEISDVISYGQAVLPLIVLHLIVPPLSLLNNNPINKDQLHPHAVTALNTLYSALPQSLLRKSFVESLVLDYDSKNNYLTWLTHIFVHYNYHHMFSNMSSIFALGAPVFREFGALQMNGLFLLGG